MPTLAQFNAVRKPFETQYFATPNPGPHTRTIMVSSHIWWTEHLALAMLNAGHNVLLHFALYLLYTDDEFWGQFGCCWNMVLQTLRQHNVDLIIGGNATPRPASCCIRRRRCRSFTTGGMSRGRSRRWPSGCRQRRRITCGFCVIPRR